MAQLPNTAKVSEIIASLQDSTAVNVRPDLAQRIGSPALGTDAMSTMLDKFDTIRTNMINDLKAKGYTLTGNESIADLEAIVKGANLVNTTTANGATAAQILTGREAFANGSKVAGTMANFYGDTAGKPAWSFTGESGRIKVVPSSGYYDAGATVLVNDPDFIAANFLSTKNVFGLQGTIPDRSTAYQAALALNGAFQPNRIYAMPPAGYYDGASNNAYIYIEDADYIAANIRAGVNLFGLVGSLVEGRQSANGTGTTDGNMYVTVSGLAFTPSIMVVVDTVHSSNTYSYMAVYTAKSNFINGSSLYYHVNLSTGSTTVGTAQATVTTGGFSMQVPAVGATVTWLAIQ